MFTVFFQSDDNDRFDVATFFTLSDAIAFAKKENDESEANVMHVETRQHVLEQIRVEARNDKLNNVNNDLKYASESLFYYTYRDAWGA